MYKRQKLDRGILEIVDTESLVPEGHLLRKIDAAVDFNRIYEMVESLYSEDNGRPVSYTHLIEKRLVILPGKGNLDFEQ